MYPTLLRLAFISLFWTLCFPAAAVDFYDVEILIFRQLISQGDDEVLDLPTTTHLDLNLELERLLTKATSINVEPAIEGYLMESSQRLAASPNYQILYHGRWSQTTADLKTAPYVRIDLPSIHTSYALAGVVRLFSTDLLYVDTMLRYRPAADHGQLQTPGLEANAAGPYYFLQERRRVKFRELHFLDHPRFGILLGVWPVNLPELPPPTEQILPTPKSAIEEPTPMDTGIGNN